jgi:hypothetical protein
VVVDTQRIRQAVADRLASATRVDEPFPHVRVNEVLPWEVYQALAESWPPDEVFWSDRPNRGDLVPRPPGTAPADARADGYDRMPADRRAVWDAFVLDINRAVVGPWLTQVFAPEIERRLTLLRECQLPDRPHYLQPPFHLQMNVGRLMIRGRGYRLRPHVDSVAYLATALYYFPRPGDSAGMGTTLFRATRPLSDEAILARGKTAYFDEAGISLERVTDVPFAANTLLAFANTGWSAHGMRIDADVRRRAYQSHLSLKSDQDHL